MLFNGFYIDFHRKKRYDIWDGKEESLMAKVIMVQGTMSNVGKSLIAAGLCRIFRQDGFRVAPFKSQNMALNSFITEDGLEMGRAQVMQAEAAGIKPSVWMNPVLLKPTNDIGSQVIVEGEVRGNMNARDYFSYKKELIPNIVHAFNKLEKQADIIVIEGAGSPAEINLKSDDIVNMGLAKMVNAPVLLVGDIDRGGVFAQLLGTMMLLEEDEKARVKGLVINKFRGDKTILDPGIDMLEKRADVPVAGVVPYMNLELEDEDSLSGRFGKKEIGLVDLAVIRYPRISNFTDFHVFEQMEGVSVRYVDSVSALGNPDMILLPGSKNTMGDLKWMRQNGLEASVKKRAEHIPVWGICGGYQMLGKSISDPDMVEEGGCMSGMGLLDVETVLCPGKTRMQTHGRFDRLEGIFAELTGMELMGYEIHMGQTKVHSDSHTAILGEKTDGAFFGNVYGSYVHGIFDAAGVAARMVNLLAKRKGITWQADASYDYAQLKEKQYDELADTLRKHMDIPYIYSILCEADL